MKYLGFIVIVDLYVILKLIIIQLLTYRGQRSFGGKHSRHANWDNKILNNSTEIFRSTRAILLSRIIEANCSLAGGYSLIMT